MDHGIYRSNRAHKADSAAFAFVVGWEGKDEGGKGVTSKDPRFNRYPLKLGLTCRSGQSGLLAFDFCERPDFRILAADFAKIATCGRKDGAKNNKTRVFSEKC